MTNISQEILDMEYEGCYNVEQLEPETIRSLSRHENLSSWEEYSEMEGEEDLSKYQEFFDEFDREYQQYLKG